MKILAIDPGTRFAGYAVMQKKGRSIQLLDHGLLKIKTTNGWTHRVGTYYDFFLKKIQDHKVEDLCFETPFLYRNPSTFMKLGYIRGINYLLAHQFNLNLHEYSPSEVKQATCLKGNASKQQVACAVYKYFPTLERSLKDDITDAISVGLCRLVANRLYNKPS